MVRVACTGHELQPLLSTVTEKMYSQGWEKTIGLFFYRPISSSFYRSRQESMTTYLFLDSQEKKRVTFSSKVAAQYFTDDMSGGCYPAQCIEVTIFSGSLQFSLQKYFQLVLNYSNFCHI